MRARGYRYHDRETPFREGYLITWVDQGKPREQALDEAIERTNTALESRSSTNPLIQRVHMIRDIVFEARAQPRWIHTNVTGGIYRLNFLLVPPTT